MKPTTLSSLRRITSSAFVTCVVATTIAAASSGCSGDKVTQGELILAVQTDMSLPKDVDEVRIEVTSFGNVVFKNRYPVGAGGLRIPATLGILPGANARALVTIRVIAMQRGKARMLREVVTTVPAARLATLRLPIQWLSDGSAKVQGSDTSTDGGTSFRSLHPAAGEIGDEIIVSTCPAEQTNIAGECVDWNVDSDTLPDYSAEDVFGGGKEDGTGGACFDTLGCMQNAITVHPDGSCTIVPPSAEPGRLNVALRLPLGGDGICDDAHCYIPLDSAVGSGWVGTSDGSGTGSIDKPPTTEADGGTGTGPTVDASTQPPPDAGRINRIHEQAGNTDSGLVSSGPITSIKLPAVICRKLTAGLDAQVVVSTGCATKLPSNPTCGPWSSVTGNGGTPPSNGGDGGSAPLDASTSEDASTRPDASIVDSSVPKFILSIQPSNLTVNPSDVVQYTAFLYDGVNNNPTSATWSIDNPSIGAIDSKTGVFTAGQLSGFTFVRAVTTNPPGNAETMITVGQTGSDAGADATLPPDAAVADSGISCGAPFCNTNPGDGGPGSCDCSATCTTGGVSMICDGTTCVCSGGTGNSAPQGSSCSQPATQFNGLCLGQ